MPETAENVNAKLDKILDKIEQVNERVTHIQVESANHRAESVEKFSQMVFQTSQSFDTKLSASERRVEDKLLARAEKVDKWFDDRDKEFADFKTDVATKITSVSVKMGVIFSIATVLFGAIIAAVVRAITVTN